MRWLAGSRRWLALVRARRRPHNNPQYITPSCQAQPDIRARQGPCRAPVCPGVLLLLSCLFLLRPLPRPPSPSPRLPREPRPALHRLPSVLRCIGAALAPDLLWPAATRRCCWCGGVSLADDHHKGQLISGLLASQAIAASPSLIDDLSSLHLLARTPPPSASSASPAAAVHVSTSLVRCAHPAAELGTASDAHLLFPLSACAHRNADARDNHHATATQGATCIHNISLHRPCI